MWCYSGQVHVQGGAHEETPLSASLVINEALRFLAETGMDFSVVQGEVVCS